jgi:hypothetical protein
VSSATSKSPTSTIPLSLVEPERRVSVALPILVAIIEFKENYFGTIPNNTVISHNSIFSFMKEVEELFGGARGKSLETYYC